MAERNRELTGRVALVTGGSRGIGKAIAIALADAGADVAVNYRERAEDAARVVESIRSVGRRATAVASDVSLGESVRKTRREFPSGASARRRRWRKQC